MLRLWPLAAALAAGCSGPTPQTLFDEVATDSGLDFRYVSGANGEYYLPEITGSGVGLVDYDGDGDLDIFFAQGAPLGSVSAPDAGGNRLYRNDTDARGALKFVDVSDRAGDLGSGFAVGVAVADIDDDGDEDLFVTGVTDNRLLRNDGGIFVDVSESAGIDDLRWNASASFGDFDGDNDLDLFVTAYLADPVTNNRVCRGAVDQRDYCSPKNFMPLADRLYVNDGTGRFEDVTQPSGIGDGTGAGLGVVASDFNGDGALDIYVANDQTPNRLWINDGGGQFADTALMAGAAYNADGLAEASMGLTAADYDDDGDVDLFMTHLAAETNTLYRNDGAGNFTDATERVRLGAQSLPYTGWGSRWFDADNDGDLDLFVANGAIARQSGATASAYGQPDQLWINDGGTYRPDATLLPETPAESSRGAAFGDIDNDGDIDIVVSTLDGAARLYLNQAAARNNWVTVRLSQPAPNREAIGARIVLLVADRAPQRRHVARDGSFASSSDVRVHFGVGGAGSADVGVIWPDGQRELFRGQRANRFLVLTRGDGEVWPQPAGND